MALPAITKKEVIERAVPHFKADPRLHLLICDCGFAATDPIKEQFPGRFHYMGIMEQATVSIAAGMASEGLRPVIYSIAQFITHRALEQLYLSLAIDYFPVKIIGVGAGKTLAHLGHSHTVRNRDINLCHTIDLPAIPDAMPNDVDYFFTCNHPCYLRCT